MLVLVTGCATRYSPGVSRPAGATTIARSADVYRDLGLITGTHRFPVVGSLSTMAGPADSTYVLLSMTLPISQLRFQRDGEDFLAEYTAALLFLDADSVVVQRSTAREQARVATFEEAHQPDLSVSFQHFVAVRPGSYTLRLQVSDVNGPAGFTVSDPLIVPSYGATGTRLATPVIVSGGQGRSSRAEPPLLNVNPGHTVRFGAIVPEVYVEAYGSGDVTVTVSTAPGDTVWRSAATLDAGSMSLRSGTVTLPADQLPLGRLWVEVATSEAPPVRTPLLLTISDEWVIPDFEHVLRLLRYIAHDEELDSLRTGTPAERREAWESFWTRRDPRPIRGINMYRDDFFQRVRDASDAFREAGRAGWQTSRGEVYVVLGPPDYIIERQIGRRTLSGRPNAEEWAYGRTPGGDLRLLFYDRADVGRLELVPASAAAFRTVAERLKPRRRN